MHNKQTNKKGLRFNGIKTLTALYDLDAIFEAF